MNQRRYPGPLQEVHDTTGAFRTPEDPISPVGEITANAGIDWRIWWYCSIRGKTGEFEVDFVIRTPEASPPLPHLSQVGEIFGSSCNHVECIPEFVSAGTGWRNWVVRLTAKECTVQALLLGPRPKCGCDPWLNARTSSEVYESLREWLKRFDQSA
jgi:hypothetical protein